MVQKNMNFVVVILVIALLVGIGLITGNNIYQGSKTSIFYDFDNLDLLNVSNIEVVQTTTEYNSLQFNENFNTSENPLILNLEWDNVDLTNVTEYEIEMKINIENLGNGSGIHFYNTMSKNLEEVHNNSFVDMINTNSYETSLIRTPSFNQGGFLGQVQFTDMVLSRVENPSTFYVKYKFNTESKYVIESVYDEEKTYNNIALSTFESMSDDYENQFDVMNNAKIVLGLIDVSEFTNNVIGNESSWSVEYVKLTYSE